jgi:hypothetical protein
MSLASKLQQSISGFNRFTSFNDAYHHKANPGSAHAKGLATDFTISDPSHSEEIANQVRQMLQASGVSGKVIDEYKHPSGHATGGHIHVEFSSPEEADKFKSGKGTKERTEQGATPAATPTATTGMTTPPSGATPAAEPVSQSSPVSSGVSDAGIESLKSKLISSQMLGMGGSGTMIGAFGPMLSSAIESLNSQQIQSIPSQNAELLQTLSQSAMNNNIVNQAAVETKAYQDQSQQGMVDRQNSKPVEAPVPAVKSMGGGGEGYAYNYSWDKSWPDWASMIGGQHWSELQNFKKNMWA